MADQNVATKRGPGAPEQSESISSGTMEPTFDPNETDEQRRERELGGDQSVREPGQQNR